MPDAGVLFAGDLLEGGAVPFFGDAYPLDWPETAFRLAELARRASSYRGTATTPDDRFADDAGRRDRQKWLFLARRVRDGDLTSTRRSRRSPFPDYPAEDVRKPLQRALAQLRGDVR